MQTTQNELITESWIPGYGRNYSIISTGEVYSHTKKNRILLGTCKRFFNGKEDTYVQLYHKGARHTVAIRTCLAMAFLGARRDDRTYWLDNDPTNIRLSNIGHKKRVGSKGTQAYKVLTKIFGFDLGAIILEKYLAGEDVRSWINEKYAVDGYDPSLIGSGVGDGLDSQNIQLTNGPSNQQKAYGYSEPHGNKPKKRGRPAHIKVQPYMLQSTQRWVPGFEGDYLVDKAARVFGVDKNGKRDFLPLVTSGQVWGKPKVKMVNRATRQKYSKPLALVVAAAWLGAVQGDKIEHIDGNVHNCAIENLHVIRNSPQLTNSTNRLISAIHNGDDLVIQETMETQVKKMGSGMDINKMKLSIKDGDIINASNGTVIATKLQIGALVYLYRKYPHAIDKISNILLIDEGMCMDMINGILSQTPTPDPNKDLSLKSYLARILSTLADAAANADNTETANN